MNTDALIAHLRGQSAPMEPQATAESLRGGPLESIRAVCFDIYGTLIISGSGDISLSRQNDRSPACADALATAGFAPTSDDIPWADLLMEQIEAHRDRRKAEGIEYPEVRIEEVWADFIAAAQANGQLDGDGDLALALTDYECRVNPCWPMPGLAQLLQHLKDAKLPLGIVSNAQFLTPLMFPAFLNAQLEGLGFLDDLCVWSYKERIGKPATFLYEKLASALAQRGHSPETTLYVGNDLRNDIWPAQKTGFRTALFAGDLRSLRWRRDDPRLHHVKPDAVITHLEQVPGLIGI
jgi:putative hydrolase of the HAD superfamily